MRIWQSWRNSMYSARIIAFLYSLHITALQCCQTEFDSIETRSILSQSVIVARIISLEYQSPDSSRDYERYTAYVQVTSVIKEPKTSNFTINRKEYYTVDGFLTSNSTQLPQTHTQRDKSLLQSSQSDNPSSSMEQHCLSVVQKDSEYILFINHTYTDSIHSLLYNAQPAQLYTKSDKNRIKGIICENCAQAPNAKAQRHMQATQGASNYKVTCRAEGNPAPVLHWYKDGVELTSDMRGIHIKAVRKRKKIYTLTLRIKQISAEDDGLYRCIATNILGQDVAKTQLKVRPVPQEEDEDFDDSFLESIEETQKPIPKSHYVACGTHDQYFCLNGGECRVMPDGRYKHCRCLARFTGARCEESNVKGITLPSLSSSSQPLTELSLELVIIIISVLASVLAVAVLLLMLLIFFGAGWCYTRRSQKSQINKSTKTENESVPEDTYGELLVQDASHSAKNNNTVLISTASQTNPRYSLNLEDHFPRSSSDLIPRRSRSSARRPLSQPVDWVPRARLSGTSALNPHVTDLTPPQEEPSPSNQQSEYQPPTNHAPARHDSPSQLQANCDETAPSNDLSLHISEASLDISSDDHQAVSSPSAPATAYYSKLNGFTLQKAYDRH